MKISQFHRELKDRRTISKLYYLIFLPEGLKVSFYEISETQRQCYVGNYVKGDGVGVWSLKYI